VPAAGDTANIATVGANVTYDYTGPAITLAQLNVDVGTLNMPPTT
jgi:hypothetical protein